MSLRVKMVEHAYGPTKVATCEICGYEHRGGRDWEPPTECFSCKFWAEKMKPAMRDDANTARINGHHYRIGDERARGMRGFDGARTRILFRDGRIVETTNLWTQGEIPACFRDRLPDNAEFLGATESGENATPIIYEKLRQAEKLLADTDSAAYAGAKANRRMCNLIRKRVPEIGKVKP